MLIARRFVKSGRMGFICSFFVFSNVFLKLYHVSYEATIYFHMFFGFYIIFPVGIANTLY